MLNNYLTGDEQASYCTTAEPNEDIAKRERLQEKHYELLKKTQTMAKELPV